MYEMIVDAVKENLPQVQDFIDRHLESAGCSRMVQTQIGMVVEEVFLNIAYYAYTPDTGTVTVRVELSQAPAAVTIVFLDRGIPFDPLTHRDPDVTLPARLRKIGNLGIYLTKKTMDSVSYAYREGQNVLTLVKHLQSGETGQPR